MIVAVRGTDRLKRAAAIGRPEEIHVEEIDRVLIFWIGEDVGVVPGSLPNFVRGIDANPGVAAVVGPERSPFGRFDQRVDALRIGGRDRHADASERSFGHAGPGRKIRPGFAAVGRFPESASGSAAFKRIGRAINFPESRIYYVRIVRIHREIDRPGFGTPAQDLLPGRSAVGGFEDAALLVRSELMAER